MDKGVKRIIHSSGNYYPNKSNGTYQVLEAETSHSFKVAEWFDGTTDAQKKQVKWIVEDVKRQNILKQYEKVGPELQSLVIKKKLCGIVPVFYLEASVSGKIDLKNKAGVYLRGYAKPFIISSKWSRTKNGERITEGNPVSYGDVIYLHLETEGLNGSTFTIEVYHKKDWLRTDELIHTYTNAPCVDGEVNVILPDTFSWYGKMKDGPDIAEFYVKIKASGEKDYLIDPKNDNVHARFLRIKNAVASKQTKPPVSIAPVKAGELAFNRVGYDSCRFDLITVDDQDSDKKPFTTQIYDASKKNTAITLYETLAGATDSKKKTLTFTYQGYSLKQCQNKHTKTAQLIHGNEKSTLPIGGDNSVKVEVTSNISLALLRAAPERYFFAPDTVNTYQLITHTCAQAQETVKINVYPNIERELGFVLTLFPGINAAVNPKFSKRESLIDYNGQQSMKLIRNETEILFHAKGGLGFGLQAKVKVDDYSSSVELGTTKSNIKKLLTFYYKLTEVLKQFDGTDAPESVAYSMKILPKVTFDLEPPNVALALRLTNKILSKPHKFVRQYNGGIALKPIIGIKIGVDILTLLKYFGVGGEILAWIKKNIENRLDIDIYIIFEVGLSARGEMSLDYNSVEGFTHPKRKIEVEAAASLKAGVKSRSVVVVSVTRADGTTEKMDVEKFKGEGAVATSFTYTFESGADNKGQYKQHKVEYNGAKMTLSVYRITEGIKYNEYLKREFTIIPKPDKPLCDSGKEYYEDSADASIDEK